KVGAMLFWDTTDKLNGFKNRDVTFLKNGIAAFNHLFSFRFWNIANVIDNRAIKVIQEIEVYLFEQVQNFQKGNPILSCGRLQELKDFFALRRCELRCPKGLATVGPLLFWETTDKLNDFKNGNIAFLKDGIAAFDHLFSLRFWNIVNEIDNRATKDTLEIAA